MSSTTSTDFREDLSFLTHPLVVLVTAIRFLAAVYILYNPFTGLILTFIFDILDAQVLIHIVGLNRSQYHIWDKNVDWLAYATELWVAAQYGLFLPFFLLLFYRFIGQFMYMKYRKTFFFVIFPNFFEIAFLWLVLTHPQVAPVTVLSAYQWVMLVILLTAKLVHEIILHYVWTQLMLPHFEDQEIWLYRKLSRGMSELRRQLG